jgi:hypothetical protein
MEIFAASRASDDKIDGMLSQNQVSMRTIQACFSALNQTFTVTIHGTLPCTNEKEVNQ